MSDFSAYLDPLLASYEAIEGFSPPEGSRFPSRSEIKIVLTQIQALLFPLHRGYATSVRFQDLVEHLMILLEPVCETPSIIIYELLDLLPALRLALSYDARAHFDGDPAATSLHEVLLAYPGFLAILIYRIAHFFYLKQVPLIPRLMSELAHSKTGVDIHPGARIGLSFCIDHGTGIVIGETAVLGDYVKLYQGVTLGALSVSKKAISGKRHPTLEDRVTVYSGTTILGGDTIIGKDTIVGGNVWITSSIPARSKVYLSSNQRQILKTSIDDISANQGWGI